ncbi:transposase family protein [Micromonospora sp. NPDC047707]|uniref:transposase family protein n=1 Tax=Micromonospora sp. NPDC047707 TaxID=3154498 RepID=UPI003451B16E
MTHIDLPAEGHALVYQARLPLSRHTMAIAGRALRQHRREVRSRWRKLPDLACVLIVLAVLRKGERPADLAAAYGVSHHSVRRWVKQVVGVLARRAPRLDRVLAARRADEDPVLLLDGTCIPVHTPAGRRERRFWCPKHKAHHVRVITVTDQHGRLLWASAAQPARLHEATHAKRLRLPARLRRHHLAVICDRFHTRLDDQPDTDPTVIVGRRASRNHKLTLAEKTTNAIIARERVANEHAHAHLKNWRILHRLRHDWRANATTLVRALLVLNHAEIAR